MKADNVVMIKLSQGKFTAILTVLGQTYTYSHMHVYACTQKDTHINADIHIYKHTHSIHTPLKLSENCCTIILCKDSNKNAFGCLGVNFSLTTIIQSR